MSANVDEEKLIRLLGGEALRPVIRKLDRRLAKNPGVEGYVSIASPSDETREAITSLLGVPPKITGPVRISLVELEKTIRDSGSAPDLSTALTVLLGRSPRHPAVEKRKEKDAWRSAWKIADRSEQVSIDTLDYLREICQNGTLRRAARGSIDEGHRIIQSLAACLSVIPLDEPTPLPIFAAQFLGDSHALDVDRPVCSLLLRAIGRTYEPMTTVGKRRSARRVWSFVNIVQDELSSTTLVLNLPTGSSGLLGRMLSDHASIGEPCRLTFRQLRQHEIIFNHPLPPIYVCENPSILAAAASQLGKLSRPLICVEGQPSHASIKLLKSCKNAGAKLYYHGDFDRAGLQIASDVIHRFQAQPWRMFASDYEHNMSRSELTFEEEVPATRWDLMLVESIKQHRKILLEESVIDDLLADLGSKF